MQTLPAGSGIGDDAADESDQEEGSREANRELEEALLEAAACPVYRRGVAAEDAAQAGALSLHQQDDYEHDGQYNLYNQQSCLNIHPDKTPCKEALLITKGHFVP